MTLTPSAESLTTRTARAAQWRFAGAAVGAVSQLVVGVLLARLLTPADFGVAALAYVVLGLAQPLGDLGLGSAIVQRARLSDRHIRAAFTCSVLVGVGIAAHRSQTSVRSSCRANRRRAVTARTVAPVITAAPRFFRGGA